MEKTEAWTVTFIFLSLQVEQCGSAPGWVFPEFSFSVHQQDFVFAPPLIFLFPFHSFRRVWEWTAFIFANDIHYTACDAVISQENRSDSWVILLLLVFFFIIFHLVVILRISFKTLVISFLDHTFRICVILERHLKWLSVTVTCIIQDSATATYPQSNSVTPLKHRVPQSNIAFRYKWPYSWTLGI